MSKIEDAGPKETHTPKRPVRLKDAQNRVEDPTEYEWPEGWTVTSIGAEGYLVAGPDGAYKTSDFNDVTAIIADNGKHDAA